MITNTLIYLIGFPGSGKLTIARELQKLVPSILVDNHHVNNVIFSLIDPDGTTKLPLGVWANVKKVREAVLDTIRSHAKPARNFIFTNALTEGGKEDERFFESVHRLALDRKASFHVFRLTVEVDEICKRIASAGRSEMFKDIDVEAARFRAETQEVLIPKSCPYHDLDVTKMSAAESARAMYKLIAAPA